MYILCSSKHAPASFLWPALYLFFLAGHFTATAQSRPSPQDNVAAQNNVAPQALLDQLEDLLGLNADQQNYDEEDLAILQTLVSSPIDLNQCTSGELLQIPFLDANQVSTILTYRKETGSFESLSDLVKLVPFTATETTLLGLILTVIPVDTGQTSSKSGSTLQILQSYSRQLDHVAGYDLPFEAGGFAGSPTALYTRIDARIADVFQLKLALEKDAGERFIWPPERTAPGFDHLTGSIEYTGRRTVRRLIIGDYKLQLGQGLLFWSNTARGKGTQPLLDPVKRNRGIRTTASREENAFLRGGAIAIQLFPSILAGGFYSNRSLDATLNPVADAEIPALGARQTSGRHRTLTELARKDAFEELIWGGMLQYQSEHTEIGLYGYRSHFSHPYVRNERPSDLFKFTGQSLSGLSLATSLNLKSAKFISEVASSWPGGLAALAGVQWQLHPNFTALFHWRKFSQSYYTFHGNAFGEQNTLLQNEDGFYVAGKFVPFQSWEIHFFIDFYRHPWLRTNISRPSSGLEYFGETIFKPRSWLQLRVQYRRKYYERNTTVFTASRRLMSTTAEASREVASVVLDYQFSSKLGLRSRLDRRQEITNSGKSTGSLSAQDFYWTPAPGTRLQLRFSMFNSGGGGATMYIYENDVRYRFTIKSFSGTGTRYFILLRKRVGTLFALEAKYGITRYGRTTNRGAGADSFSGRLVRELNLQILFHV